MGYESKIFIISGDKGYHRIIAEYDLSRMDYDFIDNIKNLFPNELNGYIFVDDEETDHDRYGEKIRYTTNLRQLANYLEESNEKEPYRRIMPLVALLRGFNKDHWSKCEELKVAHFGH